MVRYGNDRFSYRLQTSISIYNIPLCTMFMLEKVQNALNSTVKGVIHTE